MDSRLWLGANLQCLRWKRGALDGDKEEFGKRKAFCLGNKQILSAVRKVIRKRKRFCLQKRQLPSAVRKVFFKKTFLFYRKGVFSAHARPTDKEKLFTNPLRQHFSTMPKLTCNTPFQIPLATVSLQKDVSFSKLRSLASALR